MLTILRADNRLEEEKKLISKAIKSESVHTVWVRDKA